MAKKTPAKKVESKKEEPAKVADEIIGGAEDITTEISDLEDEDSLPEDETEITEVDIEALKTEAETELADATNDSDKEPPVDIVVEDDEPRDPIFVGYSIINPKEKVFI